MSIHLRSVAKRTWISVLRISLLLFLTFLMMTGMLLGTEGGRIALMKQGLGAWKLWSGQQVSFTGIRSPGLGQWQFGQVVVEQLPNIPRIELNNLEIRWEWQYAVQNRWWLSAVTADELNVQMDEPKKSSGETFSTLYALWPNIPAVRIERLNVDHLSVSRPRHPDFVSELDGQAEVNWGALPARFLLAVENTENGNNYALQLSADAIDQFRLQGSLFTQPGTAWAEWLKWQLPEPAEANWDIRIDYSQPGYLSVDVDEWTMPWQSHTLKASGQFVYDIEAIKLNFAPIAFSLDDQPASLDGWIDAQSSELNVTVDQWVIDPFAQLMNQTDLRGKMSIEALWLGGWRRPRLDGYITAEGTWRDDSFFLNATSEAELSSLRIANGEVRLANNRLNLEGAIDWITDEVDFDISGELQTDPFFRANIPGLLRDLNGSAKITGVVEGPVDDISVDLSANAQAKWRDDPVQIVGKGQWRNRKLTLSDVFIYSDVLQTQATFELDTETQQWQSDLIVSEWRSEILERLNVRFPVDFQGAGFGQLNIVGEGGTFSIGGDVSVQGLWQQWPLNAQLKIAEITKKNIRFGASKFRLGAANTLAEGNVDWSRKSIDLSFNHTDWPLSSLPPWLSFWPGIMDSLKGQWSGETQLSGLWRRPAIQTDSQLQGEWFGDPLSLTLKTNPQDATLWETTLIAEWLGADWQYSGPFWPYQITVDGLAQVDGLKTTQLPLLSREFTGKEKRLPDFMDVELGGKVQLRGKLNSPTLSGLVSLDGQVDDQPFLMNAQLGYLDKQYVDVDSANGQWADGQWSFDGLYDWRLQQVAMTIETETPDAKHLVPWLQLALADSPNFAWLNEWQGSLNGQIEIDNRTADWLIDGDLTSDGILYDEDYEVRWHGNGRLRQALNHSVSVLWGLSESSAELKSDATNIEGEVNLQWLTFEQMRQLVPTVPEVFAGLVSGTVRVDGSWQTPVYQAQLATTGQLELNIPRRFSANIDLAGNKDSWVLDKTLIDFPRAISFTVAGQGSGLDGTLEIDGILPDTRYWIANDEIGPGEAGFNGTISGNLLEPTLEAQLKWQAENWPISLQANLVTRDGDYQLQSSFYSDNQTRIKASAATQVADLRNWSSVWKTHPLNLSIAINTPFTVLDPLFVDQPDVKLAGDLFGQANMTGSLLAPQWDGEFFWSNGEFEHAAYGSLLNNVDLSILAKGSAWTLEGTANDGNQGVVTVGGSIDFTPNQDQIFAHEIDLATGFGNAQLLNRAQMDAAVTGALSIGGSYHNAQVDGELIVSPLNMQSDSFLWDGAPQLNIVSADEGAFQSITRRPFYWPQGNWGVQLIVDNRANLYGQGINAELTGELQLSDDLYEPVLAGQFNLVRGTYSGLGKVFQLTTGSVQIQNSQLVLDIQGEHLALLNIDGNSQNVLIQLRITGNQDALNLALSTDSDVDIGKDQDELLALLLFGKIVGDLDVIQAIQLANVVNKLRTGNSGFDLIGATRESFQLDSLVVDTGSDEEGNLQLNVSAGKYVNDYLYLEVEQDVGTEQEFRGSLQFQVTPNTNLQLYTQGEGGVFDDNGVELNWSWDY